MSYLWSSCGNHRAHPMEVSISQIGMKYVWKKNTKKLSGE
jgi:hypothetical protein